MFGRGLVLDSYSEVWKRHLEICQDQPTLVVHVSQSMLSPNALCIIPWPSMISGHFWSHCHFIFSDHCPRSASELVLVRGGWERKQHQIVPKMPCASPHDPPWFQATFGAIAISFSLTTALDQRGFSCDDSVGKKPMWPNSAIPTPPTDSLFCICMGMGALLSFHFCFAGSNCHNLVSPTLGNHLGTQLIGLMQFHGWQVLPWSFSGGDQHFTGEAIEGARIVPKCLPCSLRPKWLLRS